MSPRTKKTATFVLRWGIAVAGVWYVLAKTSFHDRVLIVDAQNQPHAVRVWNDARETDGRYQIDDPNASQGVRWVPRSDIWIKPDGSTFQLREPNGALKKVKLLAVRPGDVPDATETPSWMRARGANTAAPPAPAELDVNIDGKAQRMDPSAGVYSVTVPYPRVDIGLYRLVRGADLWDLLAALCVLPFAYVITSRRWHMLLEVLEIHIGQARTFVIAMVGAFYSTFMPGSTGGDLVKAYYAAKHTPHRTRAIMSVLIDRILGLLALIIVGGFMAAMQFSVPVCRHVAIGCGALLAATAIGLFVFYHPHLRKVLGVDWLIKRLPLQRQVQNCIEAMHLYAARPLVPVWAIVMTFPVHVTTIVSAYFAGRAFGLTMPFFYYWVAVPVIVLVGAIPISPQGAGVMEFFATELTRSQGVPTSQAIALAMSIRLGAMSWNLMAGIFVLRGGYHAPTKNEQATLDDDEGTAGNPGLAPA
jgi:glycosyltransferase 2 family protein